MTLHELGVLMFKKQDLRQAELLLQQSLELKRRLPLCSGGGLSRDQQRREEAVTLHHLAQVGPEPELSLSCLLLARERRMSCHAQVGAALQCCSGGNMHAVGRAALPGDDSSSADALTGGHSKQAAPA
eukprot:COSAG01_NODE_1372_length_10545_cov_12.262876_12_plen_128_part_00